MKVSSIHIDDLTPNQQSAIEQLTQNSFFASKSFLLLWDTMRGNTVYWIAEEADKLLAVLPAVEFGGSKLKRMQALPDGCYTSIFFAKEITDKHIIEQNFLSKILSHGYQKIYIYDFDNKFSQTDGFETLKLQTTLVDISASDWFPPDKKLQSEIRKAERENTEIKMFDPDKHFDKFLELMISTENRHNREPKYSTEFFKSLAAASQYDDRIIWMWCEHKNQAVSSHINFIEQSQIINWQVYYDKQFSSLKANQLMLYKLAAIARDKNLKYLNLGASPFDAQSLIEYKEKWGGEIKEYNCYSKKNLLAKLL